MFESVWISIPDPLSSRNGVFLTGPWQLVTCRHNEITVSQVTVTAYHLSHLSINQFNMKKVLFWNPKIKNSNIRKEITLRLSQFLFALFNWTRAWALSLLKIVNWSASSSSYCLRFVSCILGFVFYTGYESRLSRVPTQPLDRSRSGLSARPTPRTWLILHFPSIQPPDPESVLTYRPSPRSHSFISYIFG